ncbi:hypothetical protein NE865_06769 [Phthorimaea operculella]|nr:hypothetical protein NE865_06769 [Phthorimaea operculella]
MASLVLENYLDSAISVPCHDITTLEDCSKILTKEYAFKVMSFNIRSLQKNFDEFYVALKRLDIKSDVIVLTECHLGTCSTVRSIPGYVHFATSNIMNQAGGVVIYVKEELNANSMEPEISNADCLAVNIANSFQILGIYRSPSKTNIDGFLKSLESFIHTCHDKSKIVLVGDINIDITKYNPKSDEYLCLAAELGLKPVISLITRPITKSCLDHIFVGSTTNAIGIVCATGITDHNIVISGIVTNTIKSKPRKTITKIDYESLISDLKNTDWSEVLNATDVSSAAKKFTNTIVDAKARHTKTITVSRSKLILKDWITPGLMRCMKHRDYLHMQYRLNPKNIVIEQSYKRYRNFLQDLLKRLKTEYNQERLQANSHDPKRLWNTISSICEFDRKKTQNPELLTIKETPTQSLSVTNEFFSSIGLDLADKILKRLNTTEASLAKDIQLKSPLNSFFMYPTDVAEVMSIIKKS